MFFSCSEPQCTMNLFFFCFQRWLEPEKPLKKQIKGRVLVEAQVQWVFLNLLQCTDGKNTRKAASVVMWQRLWFFFFFFNEMTFPHRPRVPLLSELQSTILHLRSQLSAAWPDEVRTQHKSASHPPSMMTYIYYFKMFHWNFLKF